jgi:hypothetical protein
MNVKDRLVEKHDETVGFEVVAAHYCAIALYPKETRMQRARKFIHEELDPNWTGTFYDLLIQLNRLVQRENLSISEDDLHEVLAEEA